MSKLMSVLGIILLAIGVALGLLGYFNPTRLQLLTMTMETPALLVVGGILALGLGGVIAALDRGGQGMREIVAVESVEDVPTVEEIIPEVKVEAKKVFAPVETAVAEPVAETPSRIRFPGFGRRIAASTTATVVATEVAGSGLATPSVQETIEALEKAKSDINNAMGGVAKITQPAAVVEAVEEADDESADGDVELEGELYVIEEKVIRGRPARVLSDNTVEAETDEGWMRFENVDHLNEYLDAEGGEA